MAQGSDKGKKLYQLEVHPSSTTFLYNALQGIEGLRREKDFVEMKCGCTSKRYGDFIGLLRVYTNGKFEIKCLCHLECDKEKLTPPEFEKHAEKEGASKWSHHIWVLIDNDKVPLCKTELMEYYSHVANGAAVPVRRTFHRDEFIKCFKCKKERRFRLRNAEECRVYHNALANKRWMCDESPYEELTCNSTEERESRKKNKGCPSAPLCEGCTACVCLGCFKCRFLDCNCRTCMDFVQNAEP